ncbi:MAG: hypothetical protein QXX41_14875 [Nitrososphaerota archaeon]
MSTMKRRRGRPSALRKLVKSTLEFLLMNNGEINLSKSKENLSTFLKKSTGLSDKTVKKFLKKIPYVTVDVKLPLGITTKIYPFEVSKWRGREILHLPSNYPPKEAASLLLLFTEGWGISVSNLLLNKPLDILTGFLIASVILLIGSIILRYFLTVCLLQTFNLVKNVCIRAKIFTGSGKNIKMLNKKFKSCIPLSKVKERLLKEVFKKRLQHYDDFILFVNGAYKDEETRLLELGSGDIEIDIVKRSLLIKETRSELMKILNGEILGEVYVRSSWKKYEHSYKNFEVTIIVNEYEIDLEKCSEKLGKPFSITHEEAIRLKDCKENLRIVKKNGKIFLTKFIVEVEIREKHANHVVNNVEEIQERIKQEMIKRMKKLEEPCPEEVKKIIENVMKVEKI